MPELIFHVSEMAPNNHGDVDVDPLVYPCVPTLKNLTSLDFGQPAHKCNAALLSLGIHSVLVSNLDYLCNIVNIVDLVDVTDLVHIVVNFSSI